MIAPLRRRHRLMIACVALVVVPIFGLALSARSTAPSHSASIEERIGDDKTLVVDESRSFGEIVASVRVAREAAGLAISFQPDRPARHPDVLAYWSAGPPSDALPANAFLLGPFYAGASRWYALPAIARSEAGTIVLYSLAHQEVVGHATFDLGAAK